MGEHEESTLWRNRDQGNRRPPLPSARQKEGVELTALADIDAELVRGKSKDLGVKGFTDYRGMLDAEVVDAVSIATPHHLHAPMVLDCLRAGVHVFVEKPIANRVSEADEIVGLAAAKSLKLCVGHQYRTFRSSQVMKHLIETGAIGNVMRVLWSWGTFRPHCYYERYPWRSKWQTAGGGVLSSHLSHDLDTICWLVGQPVQVSAMLGNQLDNIEVDDLLCASVLFENGIYASIQATINQPQSYSVRQIAGDKGVVVIQDAQSLTYDHGERILLGSYADSLCVSKTKILDPQGEPEISWQTIELNRRRPVSPKVPKGRIRRLMNLKTLWWPANPQNEAPPPLPYGLESVLKRFEAMPRPRPHGLSVLMDSFIDAILNGGEPLVNGKDALQTLELINAIILSAVRKKTVDLPIDREEYDALFEELSSGKARIPKFRSSLAQ